VKKVDKKRVLKSQNPLLIEAIMKLLEKDGIFGLKVGLLR
jgi:hypothetical protein